MTSTPAAFLTAGVAIAAITLAIAWEADADVSALRHLYLVPAVWAGLVGGVRGGALAGLIAGLVQAPLALAAIERLGATAPGIDGLVAMAMPLALGWIVGSLVDPSRARARRLRVVLELQRTLVEELPLEQRLQQVAAQVRGALAVERVGLVIGRRTDERLVVSVPGDDSFAETSAVGWALRDGRPVVVEDIERDPRFRPDRIPGPAPLRGLVLPIGNGSAASPLGALAIERRGHLSRRARVAAEEMALHLALAVENARLTLQQRRFTDELNEKVAAGTERLMELDRAKTEFVSVVAHELRTPLTALQGFTELLLSRSVPPDRQARFLGYVHAEARRLGRIVAELLDLSRIETGRSPELRREPVDVSELLERNAELFATQHPGHRFAWTARPTERVLHADRDALDRILKNLISNAVKYSPAGGRVTVIAGPAADRPDMVELSVEDDGVGIPADEIGRIFDKYVRIPSRETAAVRGLGLGLALVRALTEAHGGWTEVESLPGKGSIFRVVLPIGDQILVNFPDSSA